MARQQVGRYRCASRASPDVRAYETREDVMLDLRRFRLWLSGMALVAACGDSTTPPAPVASVEVSAATTGVAVGHTLQLSAVVKDAGGHELTDRAVTWTSSAPT